MSVYQTKLEKIHPLLSHNIEKLIFKYPYYADIMLSTNFFESKEVPTCGVNVSSAGFNFYYNIKFLEEQTGASIVFIIIHEIFHLLFDHVSRTIGGGFNPQLANVAQDMIINSIINKDICEHEQKNDKNFIRIPFEVIEINGKKEERNTALFIPKEYKGVPVFEKLYEWLSEQKDERKKNRGNQKGQPQQGQGQSGDGQGQEQEGEGNPSDGQAGKNQPKKDNKKDQKGNGNGQKKNQKSSGKDYGKNGSNGEECYGLNKILDNIIDGENALDKIRTTLDEHLDDSIPKALRDQKVKDAIERIRNRGFDMGSFEETLKKLRKSRKDYLKEIKKGISELKGLHKNRTWQRPNRKGLPVKGFKRKSNIINLLLDTSGSMGGYFERVLSYVFQNNIVLNVIQCDTTPHDLGLIKSKNELQKMKIHGLGGTELQPAIAIIKKKYNNCNSLILTDGCHDNLDFRGIKGKVLILSCEAESPVAHSNGKVKKIVVKENE